MTEATELAVLFPVELVCQYQVSPAGGVPEKSIVTPILLHWGEFDVGVAGAIGTATAIAAKPLSVTSSMVHLAPLPCILIIYNRKVTAAFIFEKVAGGKVAIAVW